MSVITDSWYHTHVPLQRHGWTRRSLFELRRQALALQQLPRLAGCCLALAASLRSPSAASTVRIRLVYTEHKVAHRDCPHCWQSAAVLCIRTAGPAMRIDSTFCRLNRAQWRPGAGCGAAV